MTTKLSKARRALAAIALVGSLGGSASTVLDATAASAAGPSRCVRNGCDLYKLGPGSGHFFVTPGGAAVGMICWKDAGYSNGSVRWFYVSTIYGDGRAWVPANQVTNQATVRRC